MSAVMRNISPANLRGFTLIELMVTLSVMAVLGALALPSFSTFMAENRAKGKAMQLVAAVQTAQFEASRRNREVLFTFTSSIKPSASLAGDASGKSWASAALPLAGSDRDTPEVIAVGGFTEGSSDVSVTASSAGLCFLPDGSLKANSSTGVNGANCAVNSTDGVNVKLYASRGGKAWRVSISPMGKISTCVGTEDSSGTFSCS